MRIALYSRRARVLVREAHALIAERGWQGDDGIRALRAHILALPPEAPLARLTESDDFWSLSGCRDLLFHVLEHQFDVPGRSEEHTSELQSLMRISYAVFCLKKKKQQR